MAIVSFFPDNSSMEAEMGRMKNAHQRRLQLFTPKENLLPSDSPSDHLHWAYRFLRPRSCRNDDYFAYLRTHRDADSLLHTIHQLPASPRQPLVQLLLAPVRLGRISLLICPCQQLTFQQKDLWHKARALLQPFLSYTFLFELTEDQSFYHPS